MPVEYNTHPKDVYCTLLHMISQSITVGHSAPPLFGVSESVTWLSESKAHSPYIAFPFRLVV